MRLARRLLSGHTNPSVLFLAATAFCLFAFPADAAPRDEVFRLFTEHIQRQVDSDKAAFAQASACTNWFYRQQQNKTSAPEVQGVRWSGRPSPNEKVELVLNAADCRRLYPRGLDSVRDDFQRTQSSLSLSLTFYEFALVGDRDDNDQYSQAELRDVLRSLDLTYDASHAEAAQAAALTGRFDNWYRGHHLESLMKSMGQLYDQGYRLSKADRSALDRVMQ